MHNANSKVDNIEITAISGSLLILRVIVTSTALLPTVIRVRLEDWVSSQGQIFQPNEQVAPSHLYLKTAGEARITVTCNLPPNLPDREILYGAILLPGLERHRYPLLVHISAPEDGQGATTDHSVAITLPRYDGEEEDNGSPLFSTSASHFKLMGALTSLEILPAKWIVYEMVLTICNRGWQHAMTPDGNILWFRLRKTRMYKNAVLVFRGVQFPQWVLLAHSLSSGVSALSGNLKVGSSILQTWEEWLFNLLEKDVESSEFDFDEIKVPDATDYQALLNEMGLDPEKWLAYFLLGLSEISPRINGIFAQLCSNIPGPKEATTEKKKNPKDIINEDGTLQR